MMRNRFDLLLECRCVNWRAGLGLIALLALVGCGGGARKDFDLNTGRAADGGLSAQQLSELKSAFPLLGDESPEERTWRYRIAEGDQLEMVFFSHPDQNRHVTVRPDGRITMPFVGDVVAVGKSPENLATELQESYAEVLVEPRIDVLVHEMGARFYVLGEVYQSGEYAYERPLDLMQAIAQARGYRETARLSSIVVVRKGEDGRAYAGIFDFRKFLDAETRIANIEVRPDDLIWVPKSAIGRWDTATSQALAGVVQAESIVLTGWQIARFDKVYERVRF